MPSGINLSFERLSPSKGQVGYVLLTRAPVAIGCIATTMLPLDLHVLSLQLAFILSQDQTLHCKSIFNDFKFLIRTISPFCSVQDDSNLSLPIIISIDGSSFTRNLTISCQASLLYYLYCLCNSIIDRLSIWLTDFLSESGCKGKNFITYLPNIFGSFFSKLFFRFCRKAFRYHLSCERSEGPGPTEAPKLTAFRSACQPSFVSFQKTAAKVRTLSHIFQMFFELFFQKAQLLFGSFPQHYVN